MYSANDKITPIVTMYDYGYGKNLIKDDKFYDDLAKTQSKVEDVLNPSNLGSGSAVSNLVIADGNIRSGNYVTGVSGWRLTDTTAEFINITALGGTIGGWTITDVALVATKIEIDSSYPRILMREDDNNPILLIGEDGL